MSKDKRNYRLTGAIKTQIDMSVIQDSVKAMLDPALTEDTRNRLSYYLTGNIAKNSIGINHLVALGFKSEIVPIAKEGDFALVTLYDGKRAIGRVTKIDEFRMSQMHIKYTYKDSSTKQGTRTNDGWYDADDVKLVDEKAYIKAIQEEFGTDLPEQFLEYKNAIDYTAQA